MLRNYYHPVDEILADLTEARIAREKADKMLDDVLAQLGLNAEESSND